MDNVKLDRNWSYTLCKDGNARFTTVPSKAFSFQIWIRYECRLSRQMFLFNVVFKNLEFPAEKIKELLEINTFKSGKKTISSI